MITEDYISFEIAKLLKEKGFDVNAINFWHIVPLETGNVIDLEKVLCGDINEPEYTEDYYPMITLQMTMKWLREEHNIAIVVTPSMFWGKYNASIYKKDNDYPIGFDGDSLCPSHEEACEAAIKYCLENLI